MHWVRRRDGREKPVSDCPGFASMAAKQVEVLTGYPGPLGQPPRENQGYSCRVTENVLPAALPKDGGTVLYRWRDDSFGLRNTQPGVWCLRDGDSTTLGFLSLRPDGTYQFTGNEHWGLPNIDAENWRVVLAFASVPILSL